MVVLTTILGFFMNPLGLGEWLTSIDVPLCLVWNLEFYGLLLVSYEMFYLIIAILIVSYYIFMAPKTIRNTLGMIGFVGLIALLLVLAGMSFIKIMQSPPEIFLALAMVALGFFALRDVYRLPVKKNDEEQYSDRG